MLHDINLIKDDINFQISEIDKEIIVFKPLLDKVKKDIPDLIEITALASILHSFYTGLEKIFMIISKKIDNVIPSDSMWHKKLLKNMMKKTDIRDEVLTKETFTKLIEYLNFRHFFRAAYDFNLEWEKLESLVLSLENFWIEIKVELKKFLNKLN